jgi:hypothetical protein
MKQVLILTLWIAGFVGPFTAAANSNTTASASSDSARAIIPSVEEMFEDIMQAAHSHTGFYLKEADVLNLEATVSHHKKYIYYNPIYIAWLNQTTGDKWAAMTLIAHEIGHHVKGHTTKRQHDRLRCELEADEYAGYILQKMGASVEQAQKVMKLVARNVDSDTHPARSSRLVAIKTGWEKAEAEELAAHKAPLPTSSQP